MDQSRRDAEEFLILRQRRVENLLPLAEADVDVHVHRHERFEPVRHRRGFDPQQLCRNRRDQFVRRADRFLIVAEKHRAVELEMVIVGTIGRVEVERALAFEVLAVGHDGVGVVGHDIVILAAEHVDMGRHMLQMPGIRDQPAQPVAGA